ncbi:MAG: hypothetical protein KAW02_00075 [candidate division Zixibacteria bacterium]|nr:hypothetical protein [candidate division Zixibacteria bacterium]
MAGFSTTARGGIFNIAEETKYDLGTLLGFRVERSLFLEDDAELRWSLVP